MQWQKTLGGSSGDDGIDIQKTNDGSYIVACITLSNDGDVIGNHGAWDYWIVKLNSSGNIQWQKTLGGSSNDEIVSIQQVNNNNFILAGLTESSDGDVTLNHGLADYWIVKLSATVGIESYQANTGIIVYPNPASDKISLKILKQFGQTKTLEVFDCVGQKQFEKTNDFTDIDISSLTSGLYFIVLTNKDNERQIIKIIKE